MLQLQGTAAAPTQGSNAIQITIQNNNAANSVMYTVPNGRKFVGRIFNTQASIQTFINNAWVYAYFGAGSAPPQSGSLGDFTLLAGTVVKEGGTANTSMLIGVESDA